MSTILQKPMSSSHFSHHESMHVKADDLYANENKATLLTTYYAQAVCSVQSARNRTDSSFHRLTNDERNDRRLTDLYFLCSMDASHGWSLIQDIRTSMRAFVTKLRLTFIL